MKKRFASPDDEELVLNKCPLCGSMLEYNSIMQYTNVYKILKSGKLSAKRIRKTDEVPMECGFISCTNEECDFCTNCDLNVEDDCRIHVFQDYDVYKYTFDK